MRAKRPVFLESDVCPDDFSPPIGTSGGSTANGTLVIQYTYSGAANQLWTFTRTGDGYYKFSPASNAASGLDLKGWSTANGAPIQEYTYNGGANQEWTVAPAN